MTNGEGYITNSITEQVTITNSTTPQLKITRTDTGRTTIKLEGRRETTINNDTSAIEFWNYNSQASTTDAIYGKIFTRKESSDATSNNGLMRFAVSPGGNSSSLVSLQLNSDRSGRFYSDLVVDGALTADSISGTINTTRLLVSEYLLNTQRNMNSATRTLTWDGSVASNGILHTNSTTSPEGSLFTCVTAGIFHITCRIACAAAATNNRASISLAVNVFTGATFPFSSEGTAYKTYYLSTGYCRALTGTNKFVLTADTTIGLNVNDQIQFETVREYATNTSKAINTDDSDSYLIIERLI